LHIDLVKEFVKIIVIPHGDEEVDLVENKF